MVALDAASSFVLFHVAQASRMTLPHACGGNFAVKIFSLPVHFYEIFLTRKFTT